MSLKDLLAAFRRRWLVTVIGLIATCVGAAGAWYVTSPTYEVTASILLLPPRSTVPSKGNPYLQLGGLSTTVDLLAAALTSQSVLDRIEEVSADAEVEVGADRNSSAPVLRIKTSDRSPDVAIQIRDMLVEMAPKTLGSLQTAIGVIPRNQVSSAVLVQDAVAEAVGKERIQAGIVVALVGLALTAAAVAIMDGLLNKRAARRTIPERPEEPVLDADPNPVPPASTTERVADQPTTAITALDHPPAGERTPSNEQDFNDTSPAVPATETESAVARTQDGAEEAPVVDASH